MHTIPAGYKLNPMTSVVQFQRLRDGGKTIDHLIEANVLLKVDPVAPVCPVIPFGYRWLDGESYSYAAFRHSGWTDNQLINQGYLIPKTLTQEEFIGNDWANFAAINSAGVTSLFSHRPVASSVHGAWSMETGGESIIKSVHPDFGVWPDSVWMKSCIERTEEVTTSIPHQRFALEEIPQVPMSVLRSQIVDNYGKVAPHKIRKLFPDCKRWEIHKFMGQRLDTQPFELVIDGRSIRVIDAPDDVAVGVDNATSGDHSAIAKRLGSMLLEVNTTIDHASPAHLKTGIARLRDQRDAAREDLRLATIADEVLRAEIKNLQQSHDAAVRVASSFKIELDAKRAYITYAERKYAELQIRLSSECASVERITANYESVRKERDDAMRNKNHAVLNLQAANRTIAGDKELMRIAAETIQQLQTALTGK